MSTTATIILAAGLAGIGLFLAAAIVNELERIANELARANALEQQRQNEWRELGATVTPIRGKPGGPRRPEPKRPGR